MGAAFFTPGLSKYLACLKAVQQSCVSLNTDRRLLLQIRVLEETLSVGNCHVCMVYLWGVSISRGAFFCREEKGKSCWTVFWRETG